MSKFNAVVSYSDGIRFSNQSEYLRYQKLKQLESIDTIRDLEVVMNKTRVKHYKYYDNRLCQILIEEPG